MNTEDMAVTTDAARRAAALDEAVIGRDHEKARALLVEGADPDSRSKTSLENTLLMEMAYCGDIEMVKLLLAHGADATKTNTWGETPLHCAARSENASAEMVRTLLDGGTDVSARNRFDSTALHLATDCQHGKAEVIGMLLDSGADIDAVDQRGKTPLIKAAESLCDSTSLFSKGLTDAGEPFTCLINKGADPDVRTDAEKEGRVDTALSVIIRGFGGRYRSVGLELIRALVLAGARPGGPERSSVTDLYSNVVSKREFREERRELLDVLLGAGMGSGGTGGVFDSTLLHAVCGNRSTSIVDLKRVLAHGEDEDINARREDSGETPLLAYLKRPSPNKNVSESWLRLLLEHGADPGIADHNGWLPLDVALEYHPQQLYRVAEVLQEYGAQRKATSKSKGSAVRQDAPERPGGGQVTP